MVEAAFSVLIEPNGNINPPTAPISRSGDLYTLTGNINSASEGIWIARSNVVIDGAGFTLQGPGVSGGSNLKGVYLFEVSNITVKNLKVRSFHYGFYVNNASSNTFYWNDATNNVFDGFNVGFYASNNNMSWNNVSSNLRYGIVIYQPTSNNLVTWNNIENNGWGTPLNYGILIYSSGNTVHHNSFVNNAIQAGMGVSGFPNAWDNGYPSGGNYWSNYTGPDANGDGIGDTPYTIDSVNQDRYPLKNAVVIPEFPSNVILAILLVATMFSVIIFRKEFAGKLRRIQINS
jgi:parallel beta-helix repeat protein